MDRVKLVPRNIIRVGTECSGMEPLPFVFRDLGLLGNFCLVFSCERDKHCRRLVRTCRRVWQPDSAQRRTKHLVFKDITKRDPKRLPEHDLYVAGFPCQPFSSMGKRQGVHDSQGRGLIIDHIVAALGAQRPRAFILENVSGLVREHGGTFRQILHCLRAIGPDQYHVSWRILNTAQHGVPQNRARVYIIGFKKRWANPQAPFRWPAPLPAVPLARFLDSDCRRPRAEFRAASSARVRKLLRQALAIIRAGGGNPNSVRRPYVVDLDGSKVHVVRNKSPCITRARGGSGFFLPCRGRRMSLAERLRLQGLPADYLRCRQRSGVSKRQLGMMIGNAMSGNVLARILRRLLPASGLTG